MNYEEGCTHIREWTGVVELECSTKQLVQMQRVVCNVKFELEDLLLFLKHIVSTYITARVLQAGCATSIQFNSIQARTEV